MRLRTLLVRLIALYGKRHITLHNSDILPDILWKKLLCRYAITPTFLVVQGRSVKRVFSSQTVPVENLGAPQGINQVGVTWLIFHTSAQIAYFLMRTAKGWNSLPASEII